MAKRIYVGNLPWSYASSDLEALFKQYGDVAAAEVIMDRETGRSRGFGFVQMANDGDMGADTPRMRCTGATGRESRTLEEPLLSRGSSAVVIKPG